MVKKPDDIVLLTQKMDSIPFDLQSFRCIQYSQSPEGLEKLQYDLARALTEMVDPIYRFSVKPRETYEFPNRLLGDSNCLYDFSVFGDFFGVNAAKFTLQLRRYMAGRPAPDILDKSFHGLACGQSVNVSNIPWELRLDAAGNEFANFSLVHSFKESEYKKGASKPALPTIELNYETTDLRGEIGSDARSSSAWISLPTSKDFRKGEKLRLILGTTASTRKKPATKVLIRFLREDDDENEPVGIITPNGISVPDDRVIEVAIPANFAKVRVISIHGGPNPWKRFPLGEDNGLPTLVRVELIASTG